MLHSALSKLPRGVLAVFLGYTVRLYYKRIVLFCLIPKRKKNFALIYTAFSGLKTMLIMII